MVIVPSRDLQSRPLTEAGIVSSTVGVYQAESVRGARRGKLSVIVVLHNVIFYMIGSWLTLGTSFADNSIQWRLPLALQVRGVAACYLSSNK